MERADIHSCPMRTYDVPKQGSPPAQSQGKTWRPSDSQITACVQRQPKARKSHPTQAEQIRKQPGAKRTKTNAGKVPDYRLYQGRKSPSQINAGRSPIGRRVRSTAWQSS